VNWRKADRDGQVLTLPDNWLFPHYYEALNALFRVENALRIFVYVVLKNARKSKWTDLQLPSDDGGDTTIAAISKRRLAQDERFGYLGYRITSPLMHLTTGELTRLVFADAYWPMFAEFFPASREIVRTKLEEIGNIRNALAHFRPIKADDVEVVKQNANQVLTGVENAIANVLKTRTIVPSNTSDVWYAPLKQVAGQYCNVLFRQSENERWIQIRLIYSCPVIGKPSIGAQYRVWPVLTLHSPTILSRAPHLLEHVIFAADAAASVDAAQERPEFKKLVDFVFSRKALQEHFAEVKADFDSITATITDETDLIREDNLARGAIVRVTQVSATKSAGVDYWFEDTSGLRSTLGSNDPAEYWGERPVADTNFITDTTTYPWMPSEVSAEEDGPF